MPILCLTDKTVKSIPLPEKGQTLYCDTMLTGFALRVSQGGAKTFICIYGDNRRKVTIGRYGVITLQQARERARQILAQAVLNPSKQPSQLFKDALERYFTNREPHLKPQTLMEYKRLLTARFTWDMHLEDITPNDVLTVLDSIDGIAERANAYVYIKTFFNWCIERQLIEKNPLQSVKKPPAARPRDRVLTDDELRLLWRATNDHTAYSRIVRTLLTTGQREAQIAHMRAMWVDYDRKHITFPSEIMKNSEQHILPFGSLTEYTLRDVRCDSEYIFAPLPNINIPFTNWSASKKALDTVLQFPIPWVLHDLRRTWATVAARLDVDPHIIERVLSHKTGMSRIAQVYNRYRYYEQMREAVKRVEGHILQLATT